MTNRDNPNHPRRKKRIYARYFDWHDKQRKELGVVEDFNKSLKFRNEPSYTSLQINQNDPPDCLAYDEKGNEIAFEVVELVDEESVRRSEHGEKFIYYWRDEIIGQKIFSLLKNKDNKSFNGGSYFKIIVLIFTDEYTLDYRRCLPILSAKIFMGMNQIDEAFLLFSFDPNENHCPFIRLSLSN